MNQYGGSSTVNGYSAIGTMSQSTCVLNISGGTYSSAGGMAVGSYNSTGAYTAIASGTLNVSGGAAVTLGGTRGLQLGPDSSTGIGWDATVNLNGGTLTTNMIRQRGAAAVTTPTININGATIVASASSASFFTGVSHAYVYGGGVTFNDGGYAITVGQSLSAPAGNGVSAEGLTVSGGGFLDTPLVQVTGDGTGATAIATINYDTGDLTGIVVTNPGINYTTPPTFTLLEGGAGNTGLISGTATLVPNTSGSLTKNGSGTLTLSGTNTYTGNTLINNGTLLAASTAALPGYLTAGKVQVASGATVAANVGGAGQWLDTDVLALYNNATLSSGSFLGLDTTGGDFTYSNAIAGNIGFKKFGANKLTLGSVNTYNGGTTIYGGILSVASNANLGDAAGGLAFNGGKLAATGAVTMARAVTISGTGNGIDTAGNIVDIGGTKDLTWGAGTFTVDGTAGGKLLFNRTGGTTAITSGAILQINAGASTELSGAPPLTVVRIS